MSYEAAENLRDLVDQANTVFESSENHNLLDALSELRRLAGEYSPDEPSIKEDLIIAYEGLEFEAIADESIYSSNYDEILDQIKETINQFE